MRTETVYAPVSEDAVLFGSPATTKYIVVVAGDAACVNVLGIDERSAAAGSRSVRSRARPSEAELRTRPVWSAGTPA